MLLVDANQMVSIVGAAEFIPSMVEERCLAPLGNKMGTPLDRFLVFASRGATINNTYS